MTNPNLTRAIHTYPNGTVLNIAGVPCKVIGKTAYGKVIVQSYTGLTINWTPDELARVIDK